MATEFQMAKSDFFSAEANKQGFSAWKHYKL